MKKSILLTAAIFTLFTLYAQESGSEPVPGPDIEPEKIKEYAEERSDQLLGETEAPAINILPEQSDKISEEKDALETAPESGIPLWVTYLKRGEIGKIAEGHSYFFGAGSSEKSQADADSAARVEFARNVETRVESSYKELASADAGKEEYSIEMSTSVRTELSLRGISITAVWVDEDSSVYYSLIRIPRNDYTALLEQNIMEELSLQEARLAQERARVEAEAEEKRLADLAEKNRQEEEARALEEARRKQELKEQREAVMRQKYRRFMERTPRAQMIGFRNGQLDSTFQHYGLSMGISPGISPFAGSQLLQKIYFGYTIFRFIEINGISTFQDYNDDFSWASHQFGAKLRLLNNAGDIIKLTLAAGGTITIYDIFGENDTGATFFASGAVSMPMLLYSDISFHAGLDRIAAGFTTYPLFSIIGDSLGLMGEINFLIDERLRQEAYSDGVLLQAGFRFKTGEHLATTLSWEDHSKVVLGIDLFF